MCGASSNIFIHIVQCQNIVFAEIKCLKFVSRVDNTESKSEPFNGDISSEIIALGITAKIKSLFNSNKSQNKPWRTAASDHPTIVVQTAFPTCRDYPLRQLRVTAPIQSISNQILATSHSSVDIFRCGQEPLLAENIIIKQANNTWYVKNKELAVYNQ